MCADSHARQREASELARRADVVVLVDDGGDGARSAFEVCARMNARVHRVRGAQEIEAAWFTDAARVVARIETLLAEPHTEHTAEDVHAR